MELHDHTAGQLVAYARDRLSQLRGEWDQVAACAGVPYFTISKIAQGKTTNPRIETFLPLMAVLKNHEATGVVALPAPKRITGRKPRRLQPAAA